MSCPANALSVYVLMLLAVAHGLQHGRASARQRSSRRHIVAGSNRCESDVTSSDDIRGEFEKKIREAEFVFTGKVINIVEDGQERAYIQVDRNGHDFTEDKSGKVFEVRIKRALKGVLPGSLADVELTKPHTHQMVEVVVGKHGGKERNRCYHVIRMHHTAIFLAARDEDNNGHNNTSNPEALKLISNPLSLTLRNLDRVNAAVKDMSYKPRPPIIEEPCEKTYCAFGANCVTDADGRARCQCPVDCPSVFTPVCGTDGITYSNHCMLRRQSCQSEENTRVQHSGECGAPGTADRRHQ